MIDGGRDRRLDLALVGDIARNEVAGVAERVGDGTPRIGVDLGNDHLALGGEHPSDTRTDAVTGPGDSAFPSNCPMPTIRNRAGPPTFAHAAPPRRRPSRTRLLHPRWCAETARR